MAKQVNTSPAVSLIQLVWNQSCSGINHSWERYNHQVREAILMAADSFYWEEGDLDVIGSIKNSRRSIGTCLYAWEDIYTAAVKGSNMTCCVEYERWKGRVPIIADNVTHGRYLGGINRKRDRVCICSRFEYANETVHVTSFNTEGLAVACSYKRSNTSKILHRYTISAADIKADRKRRKAKK